MRILEITIRALCATASKLERATHRSVFGTLWEVRASAHPIQWSSLQERALHPLEEEGLFLLWAGADGHTLVAIGLSGPKAVARATEWYARRKGLEAL